MIAKQPRRREMFVRELEALRLLPATVRPALLASGSDLFVVEDSVPSSPSVRAHAGSLAPWPEAARSSRSSRFSPLPVVVPRRPRC